MLDDAPTLVAVEAGGFTCWSDTLRTFGDGGIALLSIFGPRNAVRAVWARLYEATKGRPQYVEVAGSYARRAEGALYATVNTPIGAGLLHTLVVHRALTRGGEAADRLLQVGPDAEHRWYGRFQRLCPVPVRPSWGPRLWAIGTAAGVIKPLTGHGVEVWGVDATKDTWAPLVQAALVSGELA